MLVYFTRAGASVLGTSMVGFGLNTPEYGGWYTTVLPNPVIFGLLASVCLALVGVSVCCLRDDTSPRRAFINELHHLWTAVSMPAMQRLLVALFVLHLFQAATSTATPYLRFFYVQVETANYCVMHVIGSVVYAGVAATIALYGYQWHWRRILIGCVVSSTALDAIAQLTAVANIIRSEWFYLGIGILKKIPGAVQSVHLTLVVLEHAETVSEDDRVVAQANVAAAVATTMPHIVGTTLSTWYCAFFHLTPQRIAGDSDAVRSDMASTYIFSYALNLVPTITAIFLMPANRAAARRETRVAHVVHGTKASRNISIAITAILVAASVVGIVAMTLALYEPTACSVFAGGRGCGG
ncbi:transmembrane protein [Achlya hypogyna]|uniref:Transmembrane protein n=1 Tax=Achlya hypogyna TaxID=1202772 RepID=A0A1V9ZI75_ACHHY|nr:transmembrane protein [Achlya hypogyna]